MAQYPATIDLSSPDGPNTGSVEAVAIKSADLDGAVTEANGKPAGGTKLGGGGTFAFSDVDVADAHSVSVSGFNAGAGNVGAAPATLAVSLVADTTNGTDGSLSWTSPSILAQWNIFRRPKTNRGV